MPNILNRGTKVYRTSVSEAAFDPADWVVEPDLSAVAGRPSKHRVINGDDAVTPALLPFWVTVGFGDAESRTPVTDDAVDETTWTTVNDC